MIWNLDFSLIDALKTLAIKLSMIKWDLILLTGSLKIVLLFVKSLQVAPLLGEILQVHGRCCVSSLLVGLGAWQTENKGGKMKWEIRGFHYLGEERKWKTRKIGWMIFHLDPQIGVTKFDTTRKHDMTRHEINRLWVET